MHLARINNTRLFISGEQLSLNVAGDSAKTLSVLGNMGGVLENCGLRFVRRWRRPPQNTPDFGGPTDFPGKSVWPPKSGEFWGRRRFFCTNLSRQSSKTLPIFPRTERVWAQSPATLRESRSTEMKKMHVGMHLTGIIMVILFIYKDWLIQSSCAL